MRQHGGEGTNHAVVMLTSAVGRDATAQDA